MRIQAYVIGSDLDSYRVSGYKVLLVACEPSTNRMWFRSWLPVIRNPLKKPEKTLARLAGGRSTAMASRPVADEDPDELLCSEIEQTSLSESLSLLPSFLGRPLNGELHFERAWAHWLRLGAPKFIVAPMVDNSELPFRMLCRKYGAQAAYTPMLHSRIFSENEKYRKMEFTTCKVAWLIS